jgi:hypothetical protein
MILPIHILQSLDLLGFITFILRIFLNLNLNFPILSSVELGDYSYKIHIGDYKFWIGVDGLIGAVYTLKTKSISFPIAGGLHFTRMATIDVGGGTSVSNYGFGVNIGLERNITNTLYFSIRVLGFIDFITTDNHQNISELFQDKTHFDYINWGINPMIGVGIRR